MRAPPKMIEEAHYLCVAHCHFPQVGNTSRVDHEPYSFRELYENGLPPLNERRDQWEGNYKEAAIFLEVN
jgi:hypothetical protein